MVSCYKPTFGLITTDDEKIIIDGDMKGKE
jgi:hypothetical protein